MDGPLAFPTAPPLSSEQLQAGYYRCLFDRVPDERFHFSVALPRSWRPVDVPALVPTPETPRQRVAYFRSTEPPRAELEVFVDLLTHEVAPADLLELALSQAGMETVAGRRLPSRGGEIPDVLTRHAGETGAVVSRWLALKDENRMFTLQARCAETDYSHHAASFFVALSSFELRAPSDWPLAERLLTFSRPRPGDFCLFYPQSWTLTPDADEYPHALKLSLDHRIRDELTGAITVLIAGPELGVAEPGALLERLAADLAVRGLQPPAMELVPSAPAQAFARMWRGRAPLVPSEPPAELSVVVGERDQTWYLLALAGPTSEAAGAIWAINARAFEILVTWFRTGEAAAVPTDQ